MYIHTYISEAGLRFDFVNIKSLEKPQGLLTRGVMLAASGKCCLLWWGQVTQEQAGQLSLSGNSCVEC